MSPLEASIVSVSLKTTVKSLLFTCDFGSSPEHSFRKVNRPKRCYVTCTLKLFSTYTTSPLKQHHCFQYDDYIGKLRHTITCRQAFILWIAHTVHDFFFKTFGFYVYNKYNNMHFHITLNRLPEHSIENCEYCLFYLMDYVLLQSRYVYSNLH